jgi:hypothetical protein
MDHEVQKVKEKAKAKIEFKKDTPYQSMEKMTALVKKMGAANKHVC